LHEEFPNNVAWSMDRTFGPVQEDFARAAHVVRRRVRWNRMSAQPLDTAGAVVEVQRGTGATAVWSNANMTNQYAATFAAMLGVEPRRLRLIQCLNGGNFGSKVVIAKNICVAGALSKVTGRPVKYIDDRDESMASSDNHACDRHYDAALAIDADGRFLSLDIDVTDDFGAYCFWGTLTHANALACPTGPYDIRSLRYAARAVLTTKVTQSSFRGAGSEPANFLLERLVDAAAAELGIDPVELRRRNFIQPDQFPYRTPQGNLYDSGSYPTVLERATTHERTLHWRERVADLRAAGRTIGMGVVTTNERSVYANTEVWMLDKDPGFPVTSTPEGVELSIDAAADVYLTLGANFVGNSPRTVAAQVVAEELGVDPDRVVFQQADSTSGVVSPGASGSRLTVMLAGAVAGAAGAVREKAVRIAAHILSVEVEELQYRDGAVVLRGDDSVSMPLAQIAATANLFALDLPEGMRTGLKASYVYDHPYTEKPAADGSSLGAFYPIVGHGCHVCVVEVDEATGGTRIPFYLAVNDSGTVVNPTLLDGQLLGGVVQGIGAALSEEIAFDPEGRCLSRSYDDYLIPSPALVPEELHLLHHETPSPFTQYGIKGAGEGGRLAAPAAVASALEDALRPFGVTVDRAPMTPVRIVSAIQAARPS
jgi:CO/xanthine dehydrogenase Mo-binding subunit